MKIAFFLSQNTECLGGADNTLFMQAVLMNAYHKVRVIIPCNIDGKYNAIFERKCRKQNISYTILRYSISCTIRGINLIDAICDFKPIEHFICEEEFDILHSVQINPTVEMVARKYRIPHVMNIYSLEEWEWRIPKIDLYPSYISCDSDYCLKQWKRYLQCQGNCIRVYVPEHEFKTYTKNEGEVVFASIGTLLEYKNQLEIIKAIEKEIHKGRKIKLLLVGYDGTEYAKKCRKYIEDHMLINEIEILGFHEDMRDIFERINVLICGSRRESFPSSVVEAISYNIPIISTPVAGIPEILINRKNAYVAEGYCADNIEYAIEQYFQDIQSGEITNVLEEEKNIYQVYFSKDSVKKQLERMYFLMQMQPKNVKLWEQSKIFLEHINSIKQVYGPYNLNMQEVIQMKSRVLFMCYIKKCFKSKECYIWGAGRWGRITANLIKHFVPELKILAFVDEKQQGKINSIDIIKKENMKLQDGAIVMISFFYGKEYAQAYLESRGKEILKDYFIIA